MKSLWLVPLLCSLAVGQGIGGTAGIGGKAGIGGGAPVAGGAGCNGASPTGCVFRETFDGALACWAGSAFTNCSATQWVNTFSGANSVYNYATSPAPLQGSFSLELINSANAQATFSGSSTLWAGAVFNFPSFPDFAAHIQITTSAFVQQCGFGMASGGTKFQVYNAGGTTVDSAAGITTGTWYIQLNAVQGSGTNAVCQLLYSSTGAAGSWTTVTSSNGTWTTQPAGINLLGIAAATVLVFDDVRVNTAQMNWN